MPLVARPLLADTHWPQAVRNRHCPPQGSACFFAPPEQTGFRSSAAIERHRNAKRPMGQASEIPVTSKLAVDGNVLIVYPPVGQGCFAVPGEYHMAVLGVSQRFVSGQRQHRAVGSMLSAILVGLELEHRELPVGRCLRRPQRVLVAQHPPEKSHNDTGAEQGHAYRSSSNQFHGKRKRKHHPCRKTT